MRFFYIVKINTLMLNYQIIQQIVNINSYKRYALMITPIASSQSVLTGFTPLTSYSSTAAPAVEKAISTNTLKYRTIETVISFLKNHGLSENDENTKSDYATLTKQMIIQTKDASDLSLDVLKFHLNNFTVVVKTFKSVNEQIEYTKKLDDSISYKNEKLDHDIYTHERKSAILNDYKDLRNNALMSDENFQKLCGVSFNNNQQTTMLYDTLFLMFIKSLDFTPVASKTGKNEKTKTPGNHIVISAVDSAQEEQEEMEEKNDEIMKTITLSKHSSIRDVFHFTNNSTQEIDAKKAESVSNSPYYVKLRQAMDDLYKEAESDSRRIDDILQNKGKGLPGSDIEMQSFDVFTPEQTFFTVLAQCTNNIKEKTDLLIDAFSKYMNNTAHSEKKQFKYLLRDIKGISKAIQDSNKQIHEIANMPESVKWIGYLEYNDLVSNIRAPISNINDLLIQIHSLTN